MSHCTVVTTRSRRSARAFTLMEMLVVVGITALLISIVLPSLNAARRQAARVACAANLRSVGQAYHIYANEYKGEYPPQNHLVWPNGSWGTPLSGPAGAPDGPAIVFSVGHLPDPRILYCDSADDEAEWNDTAAAWRDEHDTLGQGRKPFTNLAFWNEAKRTDVYDGGGLLFNQTGYAFWINQDLRFNREDPRRKWFARFKDDPADRVMASDHMTRGDAGDRWSGHKVDSRRRRVMTSPAPGFPADPVTSASGTVNFEGGNVLYNDGHVDWKHTTDTVWRFSDGEDFDAFW